MLLIRTGYVWAELPPPQSSSSLPWRTLMFSAVEGGGSCSSVGVNKRDWSTCRMDLKSENINTFLDIEAEDNMLFDEEESPVLEIPPHLKEEFEATNSSDEKVILLAGAAGIKCQSAVYQRPKRYKNQGLFTPNLGEAKHLYFCSLVEPVLAKHLSKQPSKNERSLLWPNEAEVDAECEALCEVVDAPPMSLTVTSFACFPGSGSKWLLSLIQFMSGYRTKDWWE